MRNAPTTVAQRIYDSSLGRVANAYMLAAVVMFSALPLIISWGGGLRGVGMGFYGGA